MAAPIDHETRVRHAARSIRHPLARTLLALTFTTGLVDAVSYLGLGRVFTANMTGNIALLGFGIAGVRGLPVLAPVVSLAAFLVGAGVGGALASRLAERHHRHFVAALVIEGTLIALATALVAAFNVHPGALSAYATIVLLALAMGVRNATVRRIGVPDLITTVLTSTLTSLAANSPLTGGSGTDFKRRLAAVLALLCGALAGALLLRVAPAWPLALAAVLAGASALAYAPVWRRHGSSRD